MKKTMKFSPKDLKTPKYFFVYMSPKESESIRGKEYIHPEIRIFYRGDYFEAYYYLADFTFQSHKRDGKTFCFPYGGHYKTSDYFNFNLEFMKKFSNTAKRNHIYLGTPMDLKPVLRVLKKMGMERYVWFKKAGDKYQNNKVPYRFRNRGDDYLTAKKLIAH